MIPAPSDAWYAYNALTVFERLGWKGEETPVVKLIHPHGRDKFAECGVVFIDIESSKYPDHYIRLCALFPGQQMPLHHHLERAEVFKVVAGVVYSYWDGDEMIRVFPGGLICPDVGEKHGVSTDQTGGLYVGVCHRSHLTDVYWTDETSLVAPADRVTLPPLSLTPTSTLAEWNEFTLSQPLAVSLEHAWQYCKTLKQAMVENPV
jgi:quercetin dioxygenase-like cupin family protein